MTAPAPYTTPLVLHGNVIANPNSDAVIPNASLANPLGLPMEILEIRFRLLPQTTDYDKSPILTGMGLGVKMDLGKAAVVDGYVPVGDLSSVRDSYEYQTNRQAVSPAPGYAALATPTTYGWRLKYPLLIPPGAALSCVLRPLGQNEFPVSVDVIYIARSWDASRPLPKVTKVPWVSSYESKGFDFDTSISTAASDSSHDLDIVNPFNVPLELARLGGRVSSLQPFSVVVGSYYDILIEDPATARSVFGSVEMRSSRGFDLTRKATAFGGLFPYNWRSWDMAAKWVMAPREFYKVKVNMAPPTDYVPESATSFLSVNATQFQFSVGVTGYRDVPVAALVEE